ncbi:hypothetical protein LTR37_021487 [Vermiconidia calcicola]|uniref:Uncharacterized protein n=1 Tax=Vermiconidia calcicola TaxID=1690605 RepID=A0ACC3M8E8_9PEZI|nr:hypothetical protein LTR37_021487 [Vermiconidia calcicola]
MPPVNTPAVTSPATRSPTRPQTPTNQGRPLTPLSYLSSPAPDLASTLYTSQAAEAADEANVSFLRDSLESLDQARQQPRRSHVDAQRDPRRAGYHSENRSMPSQSQHETAEDLSRRERLQRVLARLNRLHEPLTSTASAYGNRTPSPNRQSLYDWAPAYDEHNNQDENELDAILNELRRQQPDTHPDLLRVLSQSQVEGRSEQRDRDTHASNVATAELDRRRRLAETRRRDEWVSLRSRAVMQRARQEGAGSPSATERMLRYVMDRERSGMSEEEERARGTGWFRPSPSRPGNEEHRNRDSWLLPPPASEARERDRQERVEAFRRGYLAENVPPRLPRISTPVPAAQASPPNPPETLLENALKYLSDLRSSTRYEDSLSIAIDHGLATKEFFADKHDDFVMNLDELSPLPNSSWLQPGAVFEGHQHASSGSAVLTHHPPNSSSRIEQINPNYRTSNATTTGFDHPPGSTRVLSFDATRPWLSHPPPLNPQGPSKDHPHDQWPVQVTLHTIDPDRMIIQGTMEAYDVPQHPSSLSILNSASDRPKAGKKNAPITTFLEGHIVDLRTHSFLTPGSDESGKKRKTGPHATSAENRTPYTAITNEIAFPAASARTDAQNWLKLPPFSDMLSTTSTSSSTVEDSIARTLLSTTNLQSLRNEYIFMRWKERCFVHSKNDPCSASEADRSGDQDRGHGLTISGFYYVSLRRSDGKVEGLYFDPCSTPYQCLRLTGRGGGSASWGFR